MTISDIGLLFGRQPFFRPRTVWLVLIIYVVTGLTLFVIADVKRTVLIEATAPGFHYVMIALGAVIGACLTPVIWDAWTMGISFSSRPTPAGFGAVVQLIALVGAGGFAGDFVADLLIEKAAFVGATVTSQRETFEVVAYHWGTRRSDWVDLKGATGIPFSINCGFGMCRGISTGNRLALAVQTGRFGVQRAIIPDYLRDHVVPGSTLHARVSADTPLSHHLKAPTPARVS